MQVRVHGLAPRAGDAAFAFLVLRLALPVDRAGLVELLHHLAPLVPDADSFVAGLPEDAGAMRLVGIPWAPPEAGHAFEVQRRQIEGAAVHGIEAAWFFQTGTSLPAIDNGGGDDDGDAVWSHGPPPQATGVRFPVDGYPDVVEELDEEDFGIAFKLAGPWTPGESTVLLGFHAMWLAPYGERYRNAAVTIDQRHHAAHLWVDRFAVPCSPHEQVHHLLWVVSQLDEVTPILHARFGGATMAQKYGGMLGDTSEPFVLGGNPLIAVHAAGGARGVDAWIAAQPHWSNDELAQMLRELAIELATRRDRRPQGADADGADLHDLAEDEDDVDAMFEAAGIGGGDADDGGGEGDDDKAARARHLTAYTGELLAARARAGMLDPRVAGALRPLLAVGETYEHRRTAVVSVLGALRDRDSVPAMIRMLEDTPIVSALDAIVKAALLIAAASALGAIADPAAIPVLSKLVAAAGSHNDAPRAAAASALAACLAVASDRPELDGAMLAAAEEALASYTGTSAYETERRRTPVRADRRDDGDPADGAASDEADDDGRMN